MTSHQSDARQRMVQTAAGMLARYGLNATSIREMAKRAKAPLGSVYHHFPDGKHQVVVEAIKLGGAQVSASLDMHLRAGASDGIERFLTMWRSMLLQSDFHVGCPVLAVAVEETIEEMPPDARKAAGEVFRQWEDKLTTALAAQGKDLASASGLAILTVAAIEGAIALSRASSSIAPWDRVSAQILVLFRAHESSTLPRAGIK